MTRLPLGTFNKVCDLEKAGDVEGARQLYDRYTRPGAYDDMLEQAAETFRAALSNVDWVETEAIMKRMRAAKDRPHDPKSKIWETAIGDLTPRQASIFWRYLPDPLARRGRPAGHGRVVRDDELLAELRARVEGGGVKPTTAARELLVARGVKADAGLKNRADHLVKLLRGK